MKLKPTEFLSRAKGNLLISIFAIGFGIILLTLAVMISSVNATETYCREFQTKVTLAGKEENAYGTVCRGADGAWKIQPDPSTDVTKTIIVPVTFAEMEPLDEEIIALETWREDEHDIVILKEDDGETILLD